jgi:murein DD-endopeptidase MepM/ murein hydrolase activator NlpD
MRAFNIVLAVALAGWLIQAAISQKLTSKSDHILVLRSPANNSAQVFRTGDGTARVVFTPVSRGDKVEIFDHSGRPMASINWTGAFEVKVSEDSIRQSTTESGIDLNKLLKDVGTVETASGTLMVTAALPMSVTGYDGKEIPAGSTVYFGLERLAKEGAIAPVGAWGGDSMGPGGAVNEFNDRLIDHGVKGVTQPKKSTKPAMKPTNDTPYQSRGKAGAHGEGVIPRDSREVVGQWSETATGFLSSPTCVMSERDSLRTTSEFGRRRSFRTNNGQISSGMHEGIDLAGKLGAPIVAAAAGCMRVRDMRFNRGAGWGLSLVLEHGNGLSTQYSHMNNFTKEIREFVRTAKKDDEYCVKRGEQLGFIGQTGNCTGPHLHFGVTEKGKAVDPRKYLRAQSNAEFSKQCSILKAEAEELSVLDQMAIESGETRGARQANGQPTAR